jgi:hypothetical protein
MQQELTAIADDICNIVDKAVAQFHVELMIISVARLSLTSRNVFEETLLVFEKKPTCQLDIGKWVIPPTIRENIDAQLFEPIQELFTLADADNKRHGVNELTGNVTLRNYGPWFDAHYAFEFGLEETRQGVDAWLEALQYQSEQEQQEISDKEHANE